VAVADLQKLAPDGSPRDTSMRVSYAGTPHLYWNDRLIVIYAGDDPAVLAVLGGLLGMQFAGG
jgi:hypothetical protein